MEQTIELELLRLHEDKIINFGQYTHLITNFTEYMGMAFAIFCIGLFLVEMCLIYSPLYLIFYKLASVDKVIKDKFLSWLLLGVAVLLSAILFPLFFRVIARFFF